MKVIDRYQITYKNGVIQYKNLISREDYDNIYKSLLEKIYKIEINNSISKEEKNSKIRKIKSKLKELFGDEFFVVNSPLYNAIETGVLSLTTQQGGNHLIKIKKL
jgi:nitrogen regulatory protein PII-like uncharacterized protein